MSLLRGLIARNLFAVKWDNSRCLLSNYSDRVTVVCENVPERLRNEAHVMGALYCKRLRSSRVIVNKGAYMDNGRMYHMLIPDCGNTVWSAFVNGVERLSVEDADRIENRPVWEDIPNI